MGFDEEINNNSVAQLDRAIAYEAKGCKFESYQNYKECHNSTGQSIGFLNRKLKVRILLALQKSLERDLAYWGNGNLPDCLSGTTSSILV